MPKVMDVVLKQASLNAEQSYPNECCGLLLGTPGFIREIRAAANLSNGPKHRRYVISPLDLLAAETFARGREEDVIGIYHSHPDHPPHPSEYDRKHAILDYLYLIVSVDHGRAGEILCWSLPGCGSEFRREELQIIETSADSKE